ncbi:UDP-glucosyltransferase 2 [Frankliniella fusca]|uniref:UDP-glucosyltransferase 2 n=1 Tax=Frankliniella fusca TaxID=407009 RepID=A0AAE1HA02_9NEOP|nr:UDP-glucosyltransferase 2 [Frankliniella fusca]
MRSAAAAAAVLALAVLAGTVPRSDGLRALMVFPFGAHSHNTMFSAMAKALVERGHQVVMFSNFPPRAAHPNYTHVDTSGTESLVSAIDLEEIKALPIDIPPLLAYLYAAAISRMGGDTLCRHVLAMPEVHQVLAGGYGRFDVVLTEAFASDCWLGIPHRLGLPVVSLASGPDWPWIHERMGSVDNPSYIVNVFSKIKEPMSFMDRVYNTVFTASLNYFMQKMCQASIYGSPALAVARGQTSQQNYIKLASFDDDSDATMREFLGADLPPQRELVKNTSLILLNRHVSINPARPVTPNIVHVGSLHVTEPPNTLEPGLRAWMDGAEHGVIFFSLGSMIKASSMPVEMRDKLVWAFSRLKQRVVWKFEDDSLAMPENVRVAKWLPQMDVLTHPKTVLFITHGGLMGTLEALHCGVPMLGMPLFADQGVNMDMYKKLGIADYVDRHTMTKEGFLAAIQAMTDKRYRERSREVAALHQDRPRTAADEAVWWVEYVVRHGGAPHLRPRSVGMPLYQYLLLDVFAFLGALALALAALGALVARRVLGALVARVRPAGPTAADVKAKQS